MKKICIICKEEFEGGNKAEYCDKCRTRVRAYQEKINRQKRQQALSNPQVYIREDCQIYDKIKKKCKGLKHLYCQFEMCKFYKKG